MCARGGGEGHLHFNFIPRRFFREGPNIKDRAKEGYFTPSMRLAKMGEVWGDLRQSKGLMRPREG